MSLTPAMTADRAMNCALEARAMRRASVVLPVPGGPQKMSECSCPERIALESALPGPRRWRWPTNSSSVRGRMRSASGRSAPGSPASAPLMGEARAAHGSLARRADDVDTRRWGEAHLGVAHRGVAAHLVEDDGGGLPELVLEDHALELAVREAEERAAKVRSFRRDRLDQHPLEPPALARPADPDALAHARRPGEQHRRGRRKRRVHRLHGHLREVTVEDPQVLAAAYQELPRPARTARLALRVDLPAETPGPRDDQRAGGAIDLAPVCIRERLQKARAQRLEIIEVAIERRAAGGRAMRALREP